MKTWATTPTDPTGRAIRMTIYDTNNHKHSKSVTEAEIIAEGENFDDLLAQMKLFGRGCCGGSIEQDGVEFDKMAYVNMEWSDGLSETFINPQNIVSVDIEVVEYEL